MVKYRKHSGGEQLVETINTTSMKDIIEDFQVYNQLLQEECYLVFQQLHATGQFLASPSIYAYETVFDDKSFINVQLAFDALMSDLETNEDFVIDTVFDTDYEENAEFLQGGAGIDISIDLSNITQESVSSYSTKVLLSLIQKYERNYQELSLQQQQSLTLCITEYQVKAMTSLNKLYLGDVGISCMLFTAFTNMGDVLQKHNLQSGGDLSQWMSKASDLMSSTATLTRQSVDMSKQKIRELATKTEQVAKTIAKAAHQDIADMPLNKKLNIVQNLFGDMLKWGGKQLMIRLRAPEFDVASVSDMSSFKDEIVKFIGNRINQILNKSESFRKNENLQKERLKWILTVLENIESLLELIKIISQLSTSQMNVVPGLPKVNVSASMSSGVKVEITSNEWLEEIGGSVSDLKSIVQDKSDGLLDISILQVIRDGEASKRTKDTERQLNLLKINIERKQTTLEQQPDNNIIRVELGRLITLRDRLVAAKEKSHKDIEETCIQLLQEIHSYVSNLDIPNVSLDVITKKVFTKITQKVDYSAFTSVRNEVVSNANNVKNKVVSEVSKIDIGLKAYFSCIGKYLEFCPNITNIFKHIGYLPIDLSNVVDKLGTISGFVGDVASSAGAYLQAVNICLLIIHLIVAASLNSRNKTLNKERVTLAEIKEASEKRMQKTGGKKIRYISKGGMQTFPANLPPIRQSQASLPSIRQSHASVPPLMQSQARTLKVRQGLVDKSHNMPFFVQGRKAVLNERIRIHSLALLETKFTKELILHNVLSKSINSSKLLTNNFINNVDVYMAANENSLVNDTSVLENLKKELPILSVGEYNLNTCTSIPSQLSLEEDIHVLSIFAKYQGEQLRKSFNFTDSIKPNKNTLYCSVSQKMQLEDERLQKIIASIVSNFNGDDVLSGGRGRKLKKREKEEITLFLEKKTTKELYNYGKLKKLQVNSKMSKNELIYSILKIKTL